MSSNFTSSTESYEATASDYTQHWMDLTIKFKLTASLLSFVSSGIVLGIMVLSPKIWETRMLVRTVLLTSLFYFGENLSNRLKPPAYSDEDFLDFTNAGLDATTSFMKSFNQLYPDTFCTIEGYLSQYTVQGADLTTFALALVTFAFSKSSHNIDTLTHRLKQVERIVHPITTAIFVAPLIVATMVYVLFLNVLSTKWCMIDRDPNRFAIFTIHGFTYAPRIFIILSILVMYTIMYRSFRVRIRELEKTLTSSISTDMRVSKLEEGRHSIAIDAFENPRLNPGRSAVEEEREQYQIRTKANAQRAAIMKLLFYPAAYTILWLPGLVHRFAEASNRSPDVLLITNFLQFTTHLVGFANSIIFCHSRFFSQI
ncbi:hypothetical protein HDU97_007310 [Phlyctochytrium planicorne]|nr:hypothetical protein HDU97_007310 [Phlyctochytrium planicorne]